MSLSAAGQRSTTALQELLQQAHDAKERFLFEQAKDLYERIIALEPENPEHYVEISKLWIGLHDVEQSRIALEKALELKPYHPAALSLLAIYFQDEKQDFAKAQELLQRSVEHHPNHVQSRKLLLELFLQLRQLDEASQLIEQINAKAMPSGYLSYQKGIIAFYRKETDTALQMFQAAEQQRYEEPELHRYLAQIYHQKQNKDKAIYHQQQFQKLKQVQNERKQLWQLLRLHPNHAGRWFALGIHYVSNNDLESALSYFDKGFEIDQKQEKLWSLAGKIALRLKQPKRAVGYIENALVMNSDSSDNWNNIGVCHMLNQDFEKAVHAFEMSIQKGNTNPQVQQNLELAKSKVNPTK